MNITNHKLEADAGEAAIPFLNSPNQGGIITPQYLIIHYTSGRSAASSIDWMMNPTAQASAQLVIGMDGKITQLVSFNKKAFHAGISKWNGLNGMNGYSIGIELDNPGKLSRVGNNWTAWFGKVYPDDVVRVATHKHQNREAGWHTFSEAQIIACIAVSQLLVTKYNLKDILGHEDISPLRKEDPGPAFPMEAFKSKVLGRNHDNGDMYKVKTANTNLRSGPGTQFDILGKLPAATKVEFISSNLGWYQVFLVKKPGGIGEPEGWIHGSLLEKA